MRVWFPELLKNKAALHLWVSEFVEYHLMKNIVRYMHDKNARYLPEFMLAFWFFEIEKKNNYIKALFYSKVWTLEGERRTIFFTLVDRCLNKFIDNHIRTQDRSLRYSYRKRDIMAA
jgi:hypothetical protein